MVQSMLLNGSGGMISSEPIGFVCGTKGDAVCFLVNKNVNLSFGQIVRIEASDRSFYARVVNSESSSTLETIEQLREAEGKEAFGPYSAYRSVNEFFSWKKEMADCVRLLLIQIIEIRSIQQMTKIVLFLDFLVNLNWDACAQQTNC